MTYDTGSELEEQIAAMYPAVFNGNAGDADELPHESFDTRSDNRVFTSHPQVEMFILLTFLNLYISGARAGISGSGQFRRFATGVCRGRTTWLRWSVSGEHGLQLASTHIRESVLRECRRQDVAGAVRRSPDENTGSGRHGVRENLRSFVFFSFFSFCYFLCFF